MFQKTPNRLAVASGCEQVSARTALCYGGPLHGHKIETPLNWRRFVGCWPGSREYQDYDLHRYQNLDGRIGEIWILNGLEVSERQVTRFIAMQSDADK